MHMFFSVKMMDTMTETWRTPLWSMGSVGRCQSPSLNGFGFHFSVPRMEQENGNPRHGAGAMNSPERKSCMQLFVLMQPDWRESMPDHWTYVTAP